MERSPVQAPGRVALVPTGRLASQVAGRPSPGRPGTDRAATVRRWPAMPQKRKTAATAAPSGISAGGTAYTTPRLRIV